MIFRMALCNIRRSLSIYRVYMTALVFATTVYYLLATLKYNQQLMRYFDVKGYVQLGFNMSAVVLLFVMAILIFFSSNYFFKERQQELGIYFSLGMRKYQVRLLVFLETVCISSVALIGGFLAGVFFSRLATMLLFKFIGLNETTEVVNHHLALLETGTVYVSLIVLASLTGLSRLKHFPIIRLKENKTKVVHLWIRWLLSILGLVMLASGYYIAYAIKGIEGQFIGISYLLWIPLVTLLVSVATYLIIQSVIPTVLEGVRALKLYSYQGINMMWLSQLRARMGSQVVMMTTITLLSTVTITFFCIVNSLFISEKIKVDQSPIINYQIVNPTATLSANILTDVNNSVAFSLKTTLIEGAVNDAAKTVPYQLSIISWQTYAQISGTYQFPVGKQLQGDQTKLLLAQENTKYESNTTQKLIPYQLNKQTVMLDVSNVSERQNVFSRYGDYLVVSQQKYKTLSRVAKPTSVLYIKMKAQQDSPQVVKTIKHVLNNAEGVYLYSVEEDTNFFNLTFGIIMYIGIFLALVFIVATGTIIYFKQMLDATKAKQTYQTLYRMGVSYEEMRMIVIKQLGFVFFMPLLLAIVHSLFALKAFYAIIESSFDPLILGSILLYALIYCVYYAMGVHHYLKIVCPPEMRTTI